VADPTLSLVPGRQVWVVGRTDRDGASQAEVARMVAGFLQHTFRTVQGDQPGSGPNEVFATSSGDEPLEWRVSAARPVRLLGHPVQSMAELADVLTASLLSSSTESETTTQRIIARREDLDPLPLLVASTPWYLALDVWWRGPAATIPWPCLQVTWAGTRQRDYQEADWLLLSSFVPPGAAVDPGDETWGEATAENVEAAVDEVKKQLTTGVVVALVLAAIVGGTVLASRRRR